MFTPEILIETLEEMGLETRSYSGRGMFGKYCIGVELDRDHSEIAFGAEFMQTVAQQKIDADAIEGDCLRDAMIETLRLLKSAKVDQMGLGLIIYFPSVAHPDSEAA